MRSLRPRSTPGRRPKENPNSTRLAPRRGPDESPKNNCLVESGTLTSSTRSLCFLEGVSQQIDPCHVIVGHFDGFEHSRKNRVREPSVPASPPPVLVRVPFSPTHPLNRLIAQLNKNWRVVDDPLQWILQRRKGNPRKKNSGWQDRSFCTTREALLRCVRESCGEVDDKALVRLYALPES